MLIYKKGDLLEASCALAHCVSADLAMKKGIARQIKEKFSHGAEVMIPKAKVGQFAMWKYEGRYIFHLITKNKYYEKPTMDALWSSVIRLKQFMSQHNITLLAVPKLACGLDRMLWTDIEPILKKTFEDSGILVIVYSL